MVTQPVNVDQRHELFVRLLVANQRRIQAYVFTLIFDWGVAEELTQDTCVLLWQKFDEFEPDTDFFRWACSFARFTTLKWREKQGRSREVSSSEFIELVADYQQQKSHELEDRRQALAICLNKLSGKDRELLKHRYETNHSAKQVAFELGRPITSIYQSLHRIRRALYSCIQLRLSREDAS